MLFTKEENNRRCEGPIYTTATPSYPQSLVYTQDGEFSADVLVVLYSRTLIACTLEPYIKEMIACD